MSARRTFDSHDPRRSQRPPPLEIDFDERGQLRSGRRFAALNRAYHGSERELLSHHRALLQPFAGPSTRRFRLSTGGGDLSQTTVRYSPGYGAIGSHLRSVFVELFREHVEAPDAGFEVVVTFNVILTNADKTSFSVYYGQDYRATAYHGVHQGLRGAGGSVTLVQTLRDVDRVPTAFDLEQVARNHAESFSSSNVRIHRVLNIVYLIYRFSQSGGGGRRR